MTRRFLLPRLTVLGWFVAVLAAGVSWLAEPPPATASRPRKRPRLRVLSRSRPRMKGSSVYSATRPASRGHGNSHCPLYQPDRPDLYVDLIGAIHIGDKAYYAGLNKRFETMRCSMNW